MPDPTQPFDHFSHAYIEDVQFGPRRAVMLTLRRLQWQGTRGVHGPPTQLRCGGIEEFEAVQRFFSQLPEPEVAWIRLSATHPSTSRKLFVEFMFERTNTEFLLQCQNVTIEEGTDGGEESYRR